MMLIIVALIIVGSVALGASRGLVLTVFTLFSSIAVLVLTSIIAPKVADYAMNNDNIHSSVVKGIEESLEKAENGKAGSSNEDGGASSKVSVSEEISKEMEKLQIAGFSIPKNVISDMEEEISGKITETTEGVKAEINKRISEYLAEMIIRSASFVITYLVLMVLVFILGKALDVLAKLPVLEDINKAAGGVCGFINGLIIVWIMFAIIMVFMDKPIMQAAIRQINDNPILTALYSVNPIANFLIR